MAASASSSGGLIAFLLNKFFKKKTKIRKEAK